MEQDHPVDAVMRIAGAFAAYGERALLKRIRQAQVDPSYQHAPYPDRVPPAIAAALLRPLRLLRITDDGPACVGELPFPQVHAAAACCERLASGAPLDHWLEEQGLTPWVVDAAAWQRRVQRAAGAASCFSAADAFERCHGRYVAAVRRRDVPTGALDGADGVELILDDASVAWVAVAEIPPRGHLLGSRLALSQLGESPAWVFEAGRGCRARVELLDREGVVLQPSPLDG